MERYYGFRIVYMLNTFITGMVGVHSYWFLRGEGNSEQTVLLFPAALVPSPLPLSWPTGVKSTHRTGHIFPGSLRPAGMRFPSKHALEVCVGEQYWNHSLSREELDLPTILSVLITQGSGHTWLGGRSQVLPCRLHCRQADEAECSSGQKHLDRARWNLVIWSWVFLELGCREKPNNWTN